MESLILGLKSHYNLTSSGVNLKWNGTGTGTLIIQAVGSQGGGFESLPERIEGGRIIENPTIH